MSAEFGDNESYLCDVALDDEGYVLMASDATTGQIDKCIAYGSINTQLEYPIGVNYNNTNKYTDGTYTATAGMAVAVVKTGRAPIQIYTDGATEFRATAIAVHDNLEVSANTAGTADRHTLADEASPTTLEIACTIATANYALATTSVTGDAGTNKITGLIHPGRLTY